MKKLGTLVILLLMAAGSIFVISNRKPQVLGTNPPISPPIPTPIPQVSYDPDAYISQIYTISNHVDNNNWSQANPWYQQLSQLCQQIGTANPGLSTAANECVDGSALVIKGSVCNGNCHTPYNIKTNGPIVDRGLAMLSEAGAVLSNPH